VRRAPTVLVLAGCCCLIWTSLAGAHALVRRSSPADGALLSKPPADVVITFTEAPDPPLSKIEVLDEHGRSVVSGAARASPADPRTLIVDLRPLDKGVYTVTWRTVSRVDGHVTGGSFTFGVGVVPLAAPRPAPNPAPPALGVAGRWALYWGLALILSGAVFALTLFPPLPSGGSWLLLGGAAAALVGTVAMLASQVASAGASLGRFVRSVSGQEILAQLALVVLVGVASATALRSRDRRAMWAVGAIAATAMLVHAYSGHAGNPGSLMPLDVGMQWLHIVGAGLWAGGLVWLLAQLRSGAADSDGIGRFSRLAGWALVTVAATGVARALDEVGGPAKWRLLFSTGFGLTLVVKVLLFVGLATLGAANRYRNIPRARKGKAQLLGRFVMAEILLAAGAFGATGLLSELPPAAAVASSSRAPRQRTITGSDFATSVRARLTLTPGTVGPNTFIVRAVDYDSRRPVPATSVSLRFRLPARPDLGTPTLELRRAGSSAWATGSTVLSMPGRWRITALIQTRGNAVEVPLELQVRASPQRTEVSHQGDLDLYTVSLATGDTLQTYVDPAKAGINQVHFTFFDAAGRELPIRKAEASGVPPDGQTRSLRLRRFSRGHFVANTRLTEGMWRFRIDAITESGTRVSATFAQEVVE
jgi:copper transport protein